MAVTEMLKALEAEASIRFERIRRRAEDEARAMLAAAEARRRPLREEAMARARTSLVSERARRLTRARFSVRKDVTLAKEALIDEAFRLVEAELGKYRRNPAYPAAFRALAREALQGVRGAVRISVDPCDGALAGEVLKELGIEGEVASGLKTSGGLRVELDGGRVVIDNTLESRLAKARQFLRPEVNQRLFGSNQP